ncbi:hypothetical protein QW71_35865 [Paenibacillus sp. IHB B 3415]|uniref:hypothetical protein n=1 Tax=Paenibacillus sp. IHB B 3415 TaxID=867080 RepID=UPI00057315F7|nr:hypothetical protein [Paenibacillus sp. IHB B 3415]KHL91233.1 hypothetical protein QW71_35865 [Paenibacillus sp. IHB B 3415]
MKNGKFALYLGKEYMSGLNKEGKVILRSSDLKDVDKGFELCEPFQYKDSKEEIFCIKYVAQSEVEAFYRIKTKAIYKGCTFEVADETDDMVSIVTMIGDYRVWRSFGMDCMDKGVYQKWIDKNEAVIIFEKEKLYI